MFYHLGEEKTTGGREEGKGERASLEGQLCFI
jgi:hypothetical protein